MPKRRVADAVVRDPGPEAIKREMCAHSAVLEPGDICTLWDPGSNYHGQRCQIVEGYGFHKTRAEYGQYKDSKGTRYTYRWGYVYRLNGIEYFGIAGELVATGSAAEYSHLRLVHDASKQKKRRKAA